MGALMDVVHTYVEGENRVTIGAPRTDFWMEWRVREAELLTAGYTPFKDLTGSWRVRHVMPAFQRTHQEAITPPMVLRFTAGLKPHQVACAAQLCGAIQKYGAAVDASATGTGKTFTSVMVAKNLGLPPFIVCPLKAIPQWKRVCQILGVPWHTVTNYELVRHPAGGRIEIRYYPALVAAKLHLKCTMAPSCFVNSLEHCFQVLGVMRQTVQTLCARYQVKNFDDCTKYGHFNWGVKDKVLFIFDEAHVCGGKNTLNSKLLAAVKGRPTLMVTATLAEKPMDLRAPGLILGLHGGYDFNTWCKSHGCYQNRHHGWEVANLPETMKSISAEIFPRHGVRVKISEIRGFQYNHVEARAYAVPGVEVFNERYLAAVAECEALQSQSKPILGAIQKYRQWVELFKVGLLTDLVHEHLLKNCSVVVFVNFTATRTKLAAALNVRGGPGCVQVYGSDENGRQQTPEEREIARLAFQSDQARVLLAQIQAGGVSLDMQDTTGQHLRVTLISPTWSAKELKQALGRTHRLGAYSPCFQFIVYTAGTIEERMCQAVNGKLDGLSAFNDGDLMEPDLLRLAGRAV